MTKKAELVGNYFGTIYLQIIALLQGIALSVLIPNILEYFDVAPQPWTDIRLMPLIMLLLMIFVVWHHYAIGIFFLRWFPNIIDTVIPFLITIGQFYLIYQMDIETSIDDMNMHSWIVGFSIYYIVGSVAYFSAAWRCEPELFTNIMSLENAKVHCTHVHRYYNISGCSILFQGIFGFLILLIGNYEWLRISVILFVIHLVVSEYFHLKNLKPHLVKSMEDFDKVEK